MPNLDLSQNDAEAERRSSIYEFVDPFPSIPPALLNAADIMDYAAATGMIRPFDPSPDLFKPASYEIKLGGEYVFTDETGEEQAGRIESGQDFVLESNSIAFLSLEPTFRLPAYIAIRFNLRITHIYQGLLLGTGPLVDPGFRGPLSIPLHNLTDNSYTLRGGETLIWMEFTKLSRPDGVEVADPELPRRGEFVPLPSVKRDLTLRSYLRKADPNRQVRSSIPKAIESAAAAARSAADDATASRTAAEGVQNRIFRVGAATAVGVAIAAVAVIVGLLQLYGDLNSRIDSLEREQSTTTSVPTTTTSLPLTPTSSSPSTGTP